MTDSERDPVVNRAIEELRRLPPTDPEAVRRIVGAAAALRVTPPDDDPYVAPPRRVRLWSAIGVAAAAAVIGFAVHGILPSFTRAARAPIATPTTAIASSVQNASGVERGSLPMPQQFVFNDSAAHSVSVVGDFNAWNRTSAPMRRSSDGELWSVTIPILPGRHLYGFVVNDSLFVLDPRASTARDPDLGAEGSVVIVGRP